MDTMIETDADSTAAVETRQAGAPALQPEVATTISVIVPCWREDALPAELVACCQSHGAVKEILIASASETVNAAPLDGPRVIACARPGRGNQMNEAARLATGDILLFNHADTELTDAHLESLRMAMADPALGGGAFRRRFDERHPRLRWIEPWEALRCRRFGPLFGDQSIFVRRSVFEAMGWVRGYPVDGGRGIFLPLAAAGSGWRSCARRFAHPRGNTSSRAVGGRRVSTR